MLVLPWGLHWIIKNLWLLHVPRNTHRTTAAKRTQCWLLSALHISAHHFWPIPISTLLSRALWFSVVLDGERHPQCSAWKSTGSVPAHSGVWTRGNTSSPKPLEIESGVRGDMGDPAYQVRENGHSGEKWKVTLLSLSPFSVSRPSLTTGIVTLSQAPCLSHSPWLPHSCVFHAFKTSMMWTILIHC